MAQLGKEGMGWDRKADNGFRQDCLLIIKTVERFKQIMTFLIPSLAKKVLVFHKYLNFLFSTLVFNRFRCPIYGKIIHKYL